MENTVVIRVEGLWFRGVLLFQRLRGILHTPNFQVLVHERSAPKGPGAGSAGGSPDGAWGSHANQPQSWCAKRTPAWNLEQLKYGLPRLARLRLVFRSTRPFKHCGHCDPGAELPGSETTLLCTLDPQLILHTLNP